MRRLISNLTLNQKLAIAALVLGAVAVAAVPAPGSRVTLDARELALAVSRQADRVAATDLADWIIQKRADYRLIDLRGEAAYARYHIPGAINVPLAGLIDAEFSRPDKLVLYSEGGEEAAQAWLLLKAQGYKGAYVLSGGLDAWKDQVVFPVLGGGPSAEQRLKDEKRRAVSAFFGGQPRSASAMDGGAMPAAGIPAMPTATPRLVPPPSAPGPAKAAAKKKKEGC